MARRPARLIRRAAAGVLAALWLGPALAAADGVLERLPPEFPLLRNPYFEVLVVTVEAIGGGATNADPPRARLAIEEALRGRPRTRVIQAVWRGPIRGGDMEDPPRDVRPRPEWGPRPLAPPKVGDRLIVFALAGSGDAYGVEGFAVYRATGENRETARRHMAPAERAGWLQLPVVLALLALPVLGVVLLVRGRRRWNYALLVVAPGLYAFYESGVSRYTNIRVDLLLIWPALAAVGLLALVTLGLDLVPARRARP